MHQLSGGGRVCVWGGRVGEVGGGGSWGVGGGVGGLQGFKWVNNWRLLTSASFSSLTPGLAPQTHSKQSKSAK